MQIKIKRIALFLAGVLAASALAGCSSSETASVPEPVSLPETASSPEPGSAAVPGSTTSDALISSFTTEDLDGNKVTESILAEKEYTMINVWGTYCGPCINEMPELEKLHQELPDNMQMIGVICDLSYGSEISSVRDAANEIIKETGVTYPSLLFWPDASWFYETSDVVPTTYFVDSKGNLVSDIIYGADIEAYRSAIDKLQS